MRKRARYGCAALFARALAAPEARAHGRDTDAQRQTIFMSRIEPPHDLNPNEGEHKERKQKIPKPFTGRFRSHCQLYQGAPRALDAARA